MSYEWKPAQTKADENVEKFFEQKKKIYKYMKKDGTDCSPSFSTKKEARKWYEKFKKKEKNKREKWIPIEETRKQETVQ